MEGKLRSVACIASALVGFWSTEVRSGVRLLRKVHLLWDPGEERSEKLKAERAETFWCKVTEDKEYNPRVSVLDCHLFCHQILDINLSSYGSPISS